jgi:hypothetical protein
MQVNPQLSPFTQFFFCVTFAPFFPAKSIDSNTVTRSPNASKADDLISPKLAGSPQSWGNRSRTFIGLQSNFWEDAR